MKGLLSVSFGTSYEETRKKTIDVVDAKLGAAFPDCEFYSAWTSGRIIAKVKAERDECHDTLEEAFARLSDDGVDDLIVATMCLMDGHEMRKIRAAAQTWVAADASRRLRIARPLLATADDRVAMARAVCDEFAEVPEGEALLLMGHGSPNGPNEVYSQIQQELAALGRSLFIVATVEGEPTFDDALATLRSSGAARVLLAPFMIVAGDHATNDLAGEEDDSWASRLKSAGFDVSVALKGLGQYPAVQQLVVDHALTADCLTD